jgi:predicted ATPase
MQISAFRVKNFMAFADSGWLEIKPITLLFGKNSSGKTSLLKALLLLKQSAQNGRLTYSSKEGIDVDSYRNIANGPDKLAYLESKKRISFCFRFSLDEILLAPIGLVSQTLVMNIELGWNPKKQLPEVVAFEIQAVPTDILLDETYFRVEIEDYEAEASNLNLIYSTNIFDTSTMEATDAWQNIGLRTIMGFMPDLELVRLPSSYLDYEKSLSELTISERFRDWDFISGTLVRLRKCIFDFLSSIVYVKPIRPIPERLFVFKDLDQEQLTRQGLKSFLDFLDQRYSEREQEKVLNKWIDHLGLGTQIQPKKAKGIPGSSLISEIILTDYSGSQVNLLDTGFGASQVVPFLVDCLFSKAGSTLLIQQPELHLHPAAQAELGDMFISLSQFSEKAFLIETHSEHLILRFMRRIRETYNNKLSKGQDSLDAKRLSVIVTIREDGDTFSSATQVRFNDEGQKITAWPGGFFEEGFKERFL